MAKPTMRHSRLSRSASLGMILLGVVTFFFEDGFFGMVLIVVGLAMFWFYRRQTKLAGG